MAGMDRRQCHYYTAEKMTGTGNLGVRSKMPSEALVSRRKFVLGTSAFALGLITDVSYSQNKKGRVNEDYRDFDSGTLPDLRAFGTQPAKSDEVAKADALLLAAPRQKMPRDVMKYLEALPDENVDNEAYN